ncbi:VWA domain-containing protein [Leucobacter sp. NPDC015123]|uniref:VWA domain-containing protein n=1 Tax=Leucobacter sp. NPDC015123 TaxID=3364129 RepID=UPI0036F492E0
MVLAGAVIYTGLPTAAYAVTTPPADQPTVETTGPETTEAPETDPGTDSGSETGETPPAAPVAPSDEESTPEPQAEAPSEDGSTGGEAKAAAPRAAAADVAPAAVPTLNGGPGTGTPPGASEWLIQIAATGDRNGLNSRENLAGVAFSAFQATSLTNVTNQTAVATCTTDATGQCWMKVPTRGSGSSSPGYLVRSVEAPGGWSILSTMNTSSNGLSVGTAEPYSFYTGAARSGGSAADRTFRPPTGSSLRASSGTWSSVRNNPSIPAECGIDVALLVDLSTSVSQTSGALQQIRNASSAVVSALTGTPSRVALHTFGTVSPAPGANNSFLGLTSVATAAQAQTVKDKANGLTISSSTQYTNWDAGLWSLNTMAPQLDAVIMITDGLPTVYGQNGDGARATRFFEMENAIASANAIKAQNVKIMAVGVGLGVSGDSYNLQAISGPTANSDYYQVSNWNNLEAQLRALASANCDGTVNVVKQVIPVGGTVANAQPKNNWGFTAQTGAAAVRIDEVGTTFATTASGLTGATGVLGFRSNFEGTTQANRRMSVTETLGLEHTLAPQNGKNAVCTRTDTGASVAVTNIDSPTNPGFSVDPIQNATVTCTIYNQAQDRSAQLRVDKVWKIDADGDGTFEEVTDPNVAPTAIPGLSAGLQLSDNTRLPGGVVNFGQTVSNLALDSTVAVTETVNGLPPLCTNTATFTPELPGGKVKLTLASDQGVNAVTITNTVTCETKLTLEKSVADGKTPATDWNLDAIAPGGAATGPSGVSGSGAATAAVTPGVVYPLAEEALTPAAKKYTQQWRPTLQNQWGPNHGAGSTGSWVCVAATSVVDGNPVWASNQSDGRNGGVTVQPGGWMKCTAVNEPKPTLQLVKQVQIDDEVEIVPVGDERWTLGASWTAPVATGNDGSAITPYPATQEALSGAGGFAATEVLPGEYSLTESAATAGFENGTAFSCVVNGDEPKLIDVDSDDTLHLGAGDNAVCTIVNTALPSPLTIEKSDGTVAQLATGDWQIDYTIAVKNPGQVASTYTLTDTPDLGAGFTVVSGNWVGAPAPVADKPIAAGATHEYTYRVIASFDSSTEEPSLTCDPEQGGAFFNTATIAFPGGEASDSGCGEPATPTVEKTAAQPVQNADGSWTINYKIVVTNPSDIPLGIDLADTLGELPDGATFEVQSVSSTGGTLTSAWNGSGALVTDALVPPKGALTATVTVKFIFPASTDAAALVCDQGGETGLWNTAVVDNGIGTDESTVCSEIPSGSADITKTVNRVSQLADGTWEIVYDVTASNLLSPVTATYSLADTLKFGGDITVNTATWAGPAGTTGAFDTAGTATLATNRALAAGAQDKYTVSVIASIDPAAWTAEESTLTCESDGSASGFLNTATLTVGGKTTDVRACAEPDLPTVAKTAVGAEQDATDPELWHVSYTLTVTPGSADSFYSLTDTPAFADGVTLGAGTAQRTDTDPAGAAVGITSGEKFTADPVAIAATDEPHTWLVSWEARLGDVATADAACGEPESGFFNSAALVQGDDVVSESDACIPVPKPADPTVTKNVTSASQEPNGDWTVTYDLTVTLPAKGELNRDGLSAKYNLSDTLAYGAGITVQSAAWTGPAGAEGDFDDTTWSANLATGATIAAGEALTYTVTAVARVTGEAVENGTTECVTEGDSGGFLNTAKLVSGGKTTPVEACAEPELPTLTKTAVGAVQDEADPDLWRVSYLLTVTPSGFDASYTLTDTPDFAAGIQLGDGTAQRTDTDPAQDAFAISSGQPFSVGPTAIGAGDAPHTWLVTWEARVGTDVSGELNECEGPGTGFFNIAELTQGETVIDDDSACAPVEDRVYPQVSKTVTQTAQQPDGSWTIDYDLVVTLAPKGEANPAGLSAKYDLTDVLAYGAGIDVKSASWTGPADASGDFDAAGWSASIATGKGIKAGSTHTYKVSVAAEVPVGALEEGAGECLTGGEAGGFLNTAKLVSGAVTTPVEACAEPDLPTITKIAVGAEQDAMDPELWRVSYTLTVTPSDYDSSYTLSDTPEFSGGVTLGDGTAQRTDTDPAGAELGIAAGAPFSDEPTPIGAGDAPHTWLVTWEARVGETTVAACEGPGTGFFNTAALSQGDTVIGDDTACLPVPDAVTPQVSKTVAGAIQNADGTWRIDYNLVVALAAKGQDNPDGLASKYDLSDVLAFGDGIDVKSASWTGPAGARGDFAEATWSADIAKGAAIAPGATHEYRVSVVADVTAAAIEFGSTACATEGGDGGFLNTAELTSGGDTTPVTACAEPIFPTIEKTGASSVDNGDGTFDIAYNVSVTYPEIESGYPLGVSFSLADEPQLPAGVETVGGWSAAAANSQTPAPQNPRRPATGEWRLVDGAQFVKENGESSIPEFDYLVSATVKVVPGELGEPGVCEDTEGTGIVVPNFGIATSGGFSAEDGGCVTVNFRDVGIEKTAVLAEGETSVQPGDSFDYVLTVTNHGTAPATDVKVTDSDINERLRITGLTVDPDVAWTEAPGYDGNDVELTIGEIGVGESVDVRISVEFLPAANLQTEPILQGSPAPAAPAALDELTNTACVEMAGDSNANNNCDEAEVPVRDLTATVYTLCVADAPMLGWSVSKSALLEDKPVNFRWTPDGATAETVPAEVTLTEPGGSTSWTSTQAWPGSAFTPSGVSIDYPGWRALKASDFAAGGGYLLPGTSTVMTPAQQAEFVFNGLILDPSELDFSWRGDTTIQFSVNPELTFNASYPPATAGCGVARHSQVEIEKDASVTRTQPGKSFDYTLAVKNVSDDSAAEGVVVTDKIPADLRVDSVEWAGKGNADTFPNWSECDVTGKDQRGYGGTLRCELFGPLQPKGSAEGASEAPEITLGVTVNAGSNRTDVTNTATVDYHTFGDPDDSGRDSDSATVLLWGLPVTGAQLGSIGGVAGGLLVLGGALLLWRKKRGVTP